MNELELLNRFAALDVRITLAGLAGAGEVEFDAPATVWTPALADWLCACKPALVRQLQALARCECPGCGAALSFQQRSPLTYWCADCRLWAVNGVITLAPASPLLGKRAVRLAELPEPPLTQDARAAR